MDGLKQFMRDFRSRIYEEIGDSMSKKILIIDGKMLKWEFR